LTLAAAFAASPFLPDVWYTAPAKARVQPPNWVFSPAWAVLYVLMAISA
jgi:benzodiazapine receptor